MRGHGNVIASSTWTNVLRTTDPRLGLLRSKVGLMRAAFLVYRPESWPDNKKRAPFHARLLHLMLRWTRKTWPGLVPLGV